MKDVIIVGSGPAAAFAAAACLERGIVPAILADRAPAAQQDGAFFIHCMPKFHLNTYKPEPFEVEIAGVGTPELYSEKQWQRIVPTSFPSVPRKEMWYSSTQLMQVLRDLEQHFVYGKVDDLQMLRAAQMNDYVFHTFPLPAHSVMPHEEGRKGIRLRKLKWFPVRTMFCPWLTQHRIVYNGTGDLWVRQTISFEGRVSFEFPDDPVVEMKLGYDPVYSLMLANKLRDIPPDTQPVTQAEWIGPNIIPIGRFACWDRKMLSHDAYSIVGNILDNGV